MPSFCHVIPHRLIVLASCATNFEVHLPRLQLFAFRSYSSYHQPPSIMALVDLPNELLISIVEHLTSEKDVSAFAQCSRRMYTVAMCHLYRLNILHSRCSALIWAARKGFDSVARGFFPDKSFPKPSKIAIEKALLAAAGRGDKGITKLLLENGANANGSLLNNTKLPLTSAAASGHLPVVRLLVDYGAEFGRLDRSGWCAMSHAAFRGRLEVVRFLSVDEEAVSRRINNDGCTVLHLAADGGHIDVVKFLVERGADLAAIDMEGRTPLVCAIKHDLSSLRLVETLLSYEITLGIATDRDLALTKAVETRNADIIKLLLENGADVNHKGKDGLTPLISSMVSRCPLNIIETLFTHGADFSAADGFQQTPLYWAAYSERIDYLRLLLEKGADRTECRKDGGTPLHAAALAGFLEAMKLLLGDEMNPKKAPNDASASGPENSANFDIVDREGCTPLMLAVIHSHNDKYVKIVSLLLERGADPNGSSEGYKGRPLLYIASKKGAAGIMKLLIDHGATIDVRSKKGSTPLHVATKWRRKKAVKLLLQEGANIDAKNDEGMTALDLAMENGDSRISTLLHVHNRDLKRSEDRSDH